MESKGEQKNGMTGINQRRIAVFASLCLFLMILSIGLAEGLAMSKIIVLNDAAVTINNISAQEGLFRFGIFNYLLVVILDIFAAWAFYEYLKPLNNSFSLLAAWFRLIYSAFFGIAVVYYFQMLQMTKTISLSSLELQTQVTLQLNMFKDCWNIGYVFFGLHLAFLGWVLFRSGAVPKWLGGLVLLGGVSYLIDYLCKILFISFTSNISLILGWGEVIFAFWLLLRGGKKKKAKQG